MAATIREIIPHTEIRVVLPPFDKRPKGHGPDDEIAENRCLLEYCKQFGAPYEPEIHAPTEPENEGPPLPPPPTENQMGDTIATEPPKKKVTSITADKIEIEEIDWLVENWLALGEVQIFAGVQEMGKTTIAMQLMARVTTGGDFIGIPTQTGKVVYWTGEDNPGKTIVPRLKACQADLAKVHIIDATIENGEANPFDIASDIPELCEHVAGIDNVKLLVLDPVIGIVGNSQDQYKPTVVRKALQPLLQLAKEKNMAILGITHLIKLQSSGNAGIKDRVHGSGVWTQFPRGVWGCDKADKYDGAKVLSLIKSNLAIGQHAYKFSIEPQSVEGMDKPVAYASFNLKNLEESADDIFSGTKDKAHNQGQRDRAKNFIIECLEKGAAEWRKIMEKSDGDYAKNTMERARRELVLEQKIRKEGEGPKAYWHIIEDDDEEEHPF